MTGGRAATNTLRYAVLRANLADASQRTVQRSEQLATERADALALVEAALDAAEALRRHDLNMPELSDEMTYEEWARIRLALDANLFAALRAVREGK